MLLERLIDAARRLRLLLGREGVPSLISARAFFARPGRREGKREKKKTVVQMLCSPSAHISTRLSSFLFAF